MSEEEIFDKLFLIAEGSKDPGGIVAAAVIRNGKVIASAASADDGLIHAEQRVLENLRKKKLSPLATDILFITLEPCARRSLGKKHLKDCCTQIIESGIKQVVYGANDPNNKILAMERLQQASVEIKATDNEGIRRMCLELFNSTVANPAKKKDSLSGT